MSQSELLNKAKKAGILGTDTYQLRAFKTGKPVRKATMVILGDRAPIKFMEKMNQKQAYTQALKIIDWEDRHESHLH